MKKLLIFTMLLALIVFSLYHEDIDAKDSPQETKIVVSEDTLQEESIEVYYESKDEVNTSVEKVEVEEKVFSVEIKGEFNTTRDTMVTLVAHVKNADNLDTCNYFWYEGDRLIDFGATLQQKFNKGDHNISLVVRDGNGKKTKASIVLAAYDYYTIKRFNYDPYYGNLLYVEREIMNHKGQYVLSDNATYSKEYSVYADEGGHLTEKTLEYYSYPEENRKMLYTYDDKGNRLTEQTLNAEGESVYYVSNLYDDNGSIVTMKIGTSEDDLEEINYGYGQIYYDTSYETMAKGIEIPEDIVELNDNGQVVYEEHHYGDYHTKDTMSYDENNKLIRAERASSSTYDSRLYITDYDKEGNAVKKEVKYELTGRAVACHYVSDSTFTSTGQTKSEVSSLLGGECPYIDDVKRTFTYDKDGMVANVKASTDGEEDAGFNTLKIVKKYTNELDI